MDRWVGKVAVVTGASAGIGAATCQRLVKDGLKVVGFARREERVKEIADKLKGEKGKLYALRCDVSNQEDVEKCFKWVKDNIGPVQILVNNAGIVRMGTLLEGDPRQSRLVLETNVMGVCMCTREAYRHMRDGGLHGHLVHVNSVAGHWPCSGAPPFLGMYSPSKHAVTVMTEVMRRELAAAAAANVKVTSISPGAVDTEIVEAAGVVLPPDSRWDEAPKLSAQDVADAVAYVISTPPNVLIQELMIRPMGEQPVM